jgi:hypothetical protein
MIFFDMQNVSDIPGIVEAASFARTHSHRYWIQPSPASCGF